MKKLLIAIISTILAAVAGYLYFYFKDPIYMYVSLGCAIVMIIVASVFYVLFGFRNVTNKIKMLNDRLEVWNKISYHVNQAGDEAFNKLPIAIIIYDESYTITWGNDNSKKIFKTNFVEHNLVDIDNILFNQIKDKVTSFKYFYNQKYYDVIHAPQNNLIYMFDVTDRENLQIKYNNRIDAIGIIKIDNLDEALKAYGVQEASSIRGEFLGEISDFVQKYHANLQNIDDDRMFITCDKESLQKMIQDKFDVLNKIRDLGAKNHLRTSMSIGFACYDIKSDELSQLAQSALDLAERRGGDQAVINVENEQIQYFGGKSNALEKNSLVQARLMAQALKEAIEGASNVYITGHMLPDADCIGSMLGVLKMALSIGANAKIVLDMNKLDQISERMLQLLENEDRDLFSNFIDIKKVDIKQNTLLVICDTQSPTIMCYPDLYKNISNVCVIDHHRSGEIGFEKNIFAYIVPSASSAVELVCEMFSFFNKDLKFSTLEASIMLAGMVIDTNSFTFRTSTRTFEAASILKQIGADMINVKKLLRENTETEQFIAEAILRSEVYLSDFAIVRVEDKIINDRTLLAKISDRLLTIDNIKASFTIGKFGNGQIGVSARSIDTYNVQLIMEEMGGGGHLNGAATQIKDKTIDEVYTQLKDILYRENESNNSEAAKMKVILLEDVKGRGKKDEVINVANGYGNYLISHSLALEANDKNLKELKKKKEQDVIDEQNKTKLLEKLKGEIEGKSINVYIKLGQDGKTFGHITTKQICDEFEAQTGIHLDKKKVSVPADIDFVGIFKANVDLGKDIIAQFEVHVLEMK